MVGAGGVAIAGDPGTCWVGGLGAGEAKDRLAGAPSGAPRGRAGQQLLGGARTRARWQQLGSLALASSGCRREARPSPPCQLQHLSPPPVLLQHVRPPDPRVFQSRFSTQYRCFSVSMLAGPNDRSDVRGGKSTCRSPVILSPPAPPCRAAVLSSPRLRVNRIWSQSRCLSPGDGREAG